MSRSRQRVSEPKRPAPVPADNYWSLSTRPLHGLVVLLPLLAMYELGAIFFLTDMRTGVQSTIAARKLIAQFFEVFGAFSFTLPGLALVTVLLTWHIVSKDSWKLRGWVLVGMLMEAALWALPLVVFAAVVQRAAAAMAPAFVAVGCGDAFACVAPNPTAAIGGMSIPARATIAIGAGLYEELVFRFLAIAGLHFLVKDLLQGTETAARIVAVCGSALAFAVYHPLYDPMDPTHALQWTRLIFFLGAGLFFALVYLYRGFAIVVYAHAIYDIIVLVLLKEMQG
jgi:hypothetical protein